MKKSKFISIFLVIIFFLIIIYRVISLNIYNHDKYTKALIAKTEKYVYSSSAPRGRIIDRNGNIIVDNKGINSLVYHKIKGINSSLELEIAQRLAQIITIKEGTIDELKEYWLLINQNGNDLITKEEYELYKERKLNNDDLKQLKLDRIDEEKLNNLSLLDKKSAKIYALMNKGYNYANKEIIRNLSETEYAQVMEANIPGITGEMVWERVYNYGDTLKSIIGTIGFIPKELKSEYLAKGYELTDIVGLSYLEKEYENYLKGEKALYKVSNDNTLELIKEAQKGNDLVLEIDINIELEVERIIKEKLQDKKNYRNTEYFHDSYVVLSNPANGGIIAMAGIRLNDDQTFSDITLDIINAGFTVGSAVKGATIAVGYQNNLIEPGKYIIDSCVKLNYVPAKCSHDRLGKVNDITALEKSSNYYQYLIAISLVGKKYTPNMVLGATKEHFDIYRKTLKSFGLGAITEIDLPGEKTGLIGKAIADDLLLNLAIGQYDTYTPIEMIQYVNSLINGQRIAPSLMQKIVYNDEVILEHEKRILNEINLDPIYLNRIKEGLALVLKEGTGRGYTDQALNAAGKTGTSESFYDSNFDGIIDTETITSTFAGYFPKDNPQYSLVVITPNVSHKNGIDNTKYRAAAKITRALTDYLNKGLQENS